MEVNTFTLWGGRGLLCLGECSWRACLDGADHCHMACFVALLICIQETLVCLGRFAWGAPKGGDPALRRKTVKSSEAPPNALGTGRSS